MSDYKNAQKSFSAGPAGEAYSALPDPLAVFKGPTAKGGMEGENGGEEKGKLEGREEEGPVPQIF